MFLHTMKITRCMAALLVVFVSAASAQETVYNNFGPEHNGWDYNFGMGWTVAGENVPAQYGVEQAMGFQSTVEGVVTDIWVAFFYAPLDTFFDEVTIRIARNPQGLPPDSEDVMEEWTLTDFESWSQWSPPHHLEGNGTSQLQESENYWLWAIGGETTWCGWCLNINPALTCPHTLRREGENWLPIGNETASAFRIDVGPIQDVHLSDIQIPQGFSLGQNYPNPFNPTTTIQYDVPFSSHIRLEIYDLLGRKVAALVNQTQPAGCHAITWHARNKASGVYYYTMQAGNYTEIKSMLLIK
jgi:hypothetical protein